MGIFNIVSCKLAKLAIYLSRPALGGNTGDTDLIIIV
jgi:hypothetical protein